MFIHLNVHATWVPRSEAAGFFFFPVYINKNKYFYDLMSTLRKTFFGLISVKWGIQCLTTFYICIIVYNVCYNHLIIFVIFFYKLPQWERIKLTLYHNRRLDSKLPQIKCIEKMPCIVKEKGTFRNMLFKIQTNLLKKSLCPESCS